MAKTKYVIELDETEKEMLKKIADDEGNPERMRLRARILLLSDSSNGEKLSIPKVAQRLGTTHTTVQTVRTAYSEEGLEAAVTRKTRTVSRETRKLNDDVIAKIMSIRSEEPPEGKKRWTVRLLEKELVSRGIVDSVSTSAVAKILREYGNKR